MHEQASSIESQHKAQILVIFKDFSPQLMVLYFNWNLNADSYLDGGWITIALWQYNWKTNVDSTQNREDTFNVILFLILLSKALPEWEGLWLPPQWYHNIPGFGSFLVVTASTYYMSGQISIALSTTKRFLIQWWPQKGKGCGFCMIAKILPSSRHIMKKVCRALNNFSLCHLVNPHLTALCGV